MKSKQDIKNMIELIRPEHNIDPLPQQLLHILEAPMSERDFRDILKQTIEFMGYFEKPDPLQSLKSIY